jgi:hypothetical protein
MIRKFPRLLNLKPALFGGLSFAATSLAQVQPFDMATATQTQNSGRIEVPQVVYIYTSLPK